MEECLQVSTIMIKSMDLEFMHGLTIENTKVGGRKENKTDSASILFMRKLKKNYNGAIEKDLLQNHSVSLRQIKARLIETQLQLL